MPVGLDRGRRDDPVVGDLHVEALAARQRGLVGALGLHRRQRRLLGVDRRLDVVRRLGGRGHLVPEGYVDHAAVLARGRRCAGVVAAAALVMMAVGLMATSRRRRRPGRGVVVVRGVLLVPRLAVGGRGGVHLAGQGLGGALVVVVVLVGEPARRLAEAAEGARLGAGRS